MVKNLNANVGHTKEIRSTCLRATKPSCRNDYSQAVLHDETPAAVSAHEPQLKSSPCSSKQEKTHAQQRSPSTDMIF